MIFIFFVILCLTFSIKLLDTMKIFFFVLLSVTFQLSYAFPSCPVDGSVEYMNKCFWVIHVIVDSHQAKDQCAAYNAYPANIYSESHYNSIMTYLRAERGGFYYVYLGMKYDNQVLTNYDGSPALYENWRAGDPLDMWGNEDEMTRVAIDIFPDPTNTGNGMLTTNQWWEKEGVLCEIEATMCPVLDFPPGIVSCTPANRAFQTVCRYVCPTGYEPDITGQEVTCEADQNWSNTENMPTTCNAVDCGSYGDVEDGSVDCAGGTTYTQTCRVSCKTGYEPVQETSQCQANGQWSSPRLGCSIVECEDFEYDGTRTCVPINNPPFAYTTACSVQCPEGTEVVSGSKIQRCLASGEWDENAPTCRIQMCSSLEFPPGRVSCTPDNRDYATVCSFVCNTGYEPNIPSQTVTCELDKTWSNLENMPEECNPVDCGSYGYVEGGSVQCDGGTTYSQTCSVTCRNGYELVQGTSHCQADAQWSQPRLECSRILCRSLEFSNQPGKMMCDPPGFGHPSICSFVCDAGYTLKGDESELTCESDGEWDGIEPTCKDVICDKLSFEDGTVSCPDGTGYAAVCKFECSFPLKLYGSDETTCLSSEEWSHGVPECREFSPKCDDAIEPLSCEDDCDDNSDCEVDEVCCPSSCGLTCKKVKNEPKPKNPFLNVNKQTLLLLLAASSQRKPVSRPPVRRPPQCPRCNRNACTTGLYSCPTYLNALCGTTCNGCRAHFLYRNNPRVEVGNRCLCPQNIPPNPRCGGYMCNGVRCANFPQAECRVYGCGPTCYLQFFNRFGRRVSCIQQATCQPGINSVGLCARACLSASCPKYPAAHCRVRCNGCPAEFFDQRTNMPITNCN
ncbi:E-selectin-like isoform X2 [Styela clava]